MGTGEKDQSAPGPVPDPEPASAADSGGPESPPAASDPAPHDATETEAEVGPDTEAPQDTAPDAPEITDTASPDGDATEGDDASGAEEAIAAAAVADTPQALAPAQHARRGRSTRRRRRWRRVLTSMAVTMVVMSASATVSAYVLYQRFNNQITSEEVATKIGEERPPTMPEAYGSVNILLMGSDDRTGANKQYGDVGDGTKRSDTTILLHLAADRKSSVAVSIPRDLMVQIPSCVRDDGSASRAYRDQFNHAFEIGGSACTIKTVELMTQVKIDHHIVIDFTGFKEMVDAVDGVDVCLSEPLRDDDAHLDLAAGEQKLNGEQALAFVRARHDLGDGSDTQRMVRQQRFLASLMHKVQSNGVLLNPGKLFQLLDAGTRSITADPGLDSLGELTNLAKSVSGIPSDQSAFLTVPRQPYRFDTNRDELVQPDADALFTAIRYDRVGVAEVPPGTEVENGTVHIDQPNLPVASGSSTEAAPTASATTPPTDDATTVTPRTSSAPTSAKSPTQSPTEDGTEPSADTTASPSGSSSATSGTSPSPSPSATTSAAPDVPAGPMVTVTGRTVEQDVCS